MPTCCQCFHQVSDPQQLYYHKKIGLQQTDSLTGERIEPNRLTGWNDKLMSFPLGFIVYACPLTETCFASSRILLQLGMGHYSCFSKWGKISNAMSVSLISSVCLSQQLLLEVDQNTSLLSLLNVSTALQGRGRVFGFNHWLILPRGHQPSQHN